jgi:hypothetical protein
MGSLILLFFVCLVLMFLYMSTRSSTPTPAAKTEGLSMAAREAMRRAGYIGGREFVNLTDVGLLVYRSPDEPKLVRYGDVMTDSTYLRPYAELWLPHPARGQVRFELVDHEGRVRYADEAYYDLARGQNTLLPGTWLPLQGKTIVAEAWTLRISAGSTLLGKHAFDWQPVGGGEIQRYTSSDGEISPSLQQALLAQSSRPISLDDLLASQDE